MSLSRPANFPLLKLPWLCIECVLQVSDLFDIIFFAVNSQEFRRFVRSFNIHLNRIQIYRADWKWILLDSSVRSWHFRKKNKPEDYNISRKQLLVLQKDAIPLLTTRTDGSLESYTDGNAATALKMALEFLNEVFKCSVEEVNIDVVDFPESGDIGVKSTRNLYITHDQSQPLSYPQKQKLNLLLENLEVTDRCSLFCVKSTQNGFYVDPKLFKSKELMFLGSAVWVTLEILLQFEVPRLIFDECPFSVENILSFVTKWFHSDNMKLEYLYILRHSLRRSSKRQN